MWREADVAIILKKQNAFALAFARQGIQTCVFPFRHFELEMQSSRPTSGMKKKISVLPQLTSEDIVQLFVDFRDRNAAMSPAGQNFNVDELEDIISMVDLVEFSEFEVIINKGEEASWVGFVLDGVLSVINDDDQSEITILECGSFVGEMALLEGGFRSAEVLGKAGGDGIVAVLRFDVIDRLWQRNAELANKLLMAIASDGMAKLRNTLHQKSGKKMKRKSTFRRVGSMEKMIQKDGEVKKWDQLANTEIIYRSNIVKMKREESERKNRNGQTYEEMEEENAQMKSKLKNERYLTKKKGKEFELMKAELIAAREELEELNEIRKNMMHENKGESMHLLKKELSKTKAQLKTALAQRDKWKKRAVGENDALDHYRRESIDLKKQLNSHSTTIAQLNAERENLMKTASLHERLHGDHALLGEQFEKTLQELAHSKLRTAVCDEKNRQLEDSISRMKGEWTRSKAWIVSSFRLICHRVVHTKRMLTEFHRWAWREINAKDAMVKKYEVDYENLSTTIQIMKEKQRQLKKKTFRTITAMRVNIENLTTDRDGLLLSTKKLNEAIIRISNNYVALKQLCCLSALYISQEKRKSENTISRYAHEREGLILARDRAEKDYGMIKRKLILNEQAYEGTIGRLRDELKRMKDEMTEKISHVQSQLREKVHLAEKAEKDASLVKKMFAENGEQVSTLTNQLNEWKSKFEKTERECTERVKMAFSRAEDAEAKQLLAEQKTNFVLHRLRASEARRIELENGFGTAFKPVSNVAQLMEGVQNARSHSTRARASFRRASAATVQQKTKKEWKSPFLKRKHGNLYGKNSPAATTILKSKQKASLGQLYMKGTLSSALSTHKKLGMERSLLEFPEMVRFSNHGVVILLVDSDQTNLRQMHEMFHNFGFCTRHATSMQEVQYSLREFPFDVIVSRQLFDGGTALDLLEHLYADAVHRAESLLVDQSCRSVPLKNDDLMDTRQKAVRSPQLESLSGSVPAVLNRIPSVIVLQDCIPKQTFKRAKFAHKASGAFDFLAYPQQGYDINESVQRAISLAAIVPPKVKKSLVPNNSEPQAIRSLPSMNAEFSTKEQEKMVAEEEYRGLDGQVVEAGVVDDEEEGELNIDNEWWLDENREMTRTV